MADGVQPEACAAGKIGKMTNEHLPSRWVTRASLGLLLATTSTFAALLASAWSYWLWSRAGIAFSVLLVASPIAGVVMIAIEKFQDRRRDVTWPGLLALCTGLPFLAILIASYYLRF
jgi:hypothetical protein